MTERKTKHPKLAESKYRILITDHMHPLFMAGLKKKGIEYDYQPDITPQQALAIIEKYTGIIVNSKLKVNTSFINKASRLQFIARAGSGMENIDTNYLDTKQVYAISSPEGNRDAVAEHAVGMLLSLLHKINRSDREVRKKIWNREKNRGIELMGKTVGIIGYGHTGSAFAEKLQGFGVEVIAYDKYKQNFSNEYVSEVEWRGIFQKADIVSLHIPLTSETRHMVDTAFLNKFKKDLFLINTSRGEVVKTTALIKAINQGKVKGAALDVFENEKIDTLSGNEQQWFRYLAESDKVVLTPHIAGWSFESKEKIAKILLRRIEEIL